MSRRIALLLAWLVLTAGALAAAPRADDVLASWRRALDERPMDLLERTAWFQAQVENTIGGAEVAHLRRFVLDPLLARSWPERAAAALALEHLGLHHLEPALDSPYPEVRRFAALAILGIVTEDRISPDPIQYPRPEAFTARGLSPVNSVGVFLDGLPSEDPAYRVFCRAVLRAFRPPGDLVYRRLRTGQLLAALEDDSPVLRQGAALGLRNGYYWDLGLGHSVVEALCTALQDADDGVRRAAAESLGRVTIPRGSPVHDALARALGDPSSDVVTAAADSLSQLEHQRNAPILCVEALLAAASLERPPHTRAALVEAIARSTAIAKPGARERSWAAVRDALADPAPVVRHAAVRGTLRFGNRASEVVPALLEIAEDPEPAVRQAVVEALAQLGPSTPDVVEALIRATRDPDPRTREAAVFALPSGARSDPQRVTHFLGAALSDPNWRVRSAAACSIGGMRRLAAVHLPKLVALLDDEYVHRAVRGAIEAFGRDAVEPLVAHLREDGLRRQSDVVDLLGGLGVGAVAALRELLVSDDDDLRAAGAAALGRMGAPARPAEAELIGIAAAAPEPLCALAGRALYRVGLGAPPAEALLRAAGKHRWCAWAVAQIARHQGASFPRAKEVLSALLTHDDAAIADAAADALALGGVLPSIATPRFADPSRSTDALVESLRTEDRAGRLAAARTLVARAVAASSGVGDVIERIWGVKVRAGGGNGRWDPYPEINANAVPLDPAARPAAERRLLFALAAYPPAAVRNLLERVLLVEALHVDRFAYGGTYLGKTIYLAAGRSPDLELVRIFHHEFSSLLMKSASFPAADWQAALPAGFRYGRGGRHAIDLRRTGEGTTDLFRAGFFQPYARADPEDDFNVFSEVVMTFPGWARAVARHHARLAARWRIWHGFLTRVDPAFAPPPPPQASEVTRAAVRKWQALRFGLFIHWGPVSLKGTEIGWSRGREVPVEEYDRLPRLFNPERFDAEEWVRVAQRAGMKYLVLTTKHHDGFCLWDSAETEHDIMSTPFGRDVVRELAEACRRRGLAFGTYYSVCDWHHPDFPRGSPGGRTRKPEANLDRYMGHLRRQVTELVRDHGPLLTLWFDVPQDVGPELGGPVVEQVRRLQPDILINNRAYRGGGRPVGDYDTPEQRIGGFDRDRPWETCMTIGSQWAWKPDDRLKSFEQCLRTLLRVAGGDGNFLLNVGPRPDGKIEPRQVARLQEMGAWLEKYGRTVYATRGGPFRPGGWGASTCCDDRIHLFVMRWPARGALVLPPVALRVIGARALTGGDLQCVQTDDGISISLPPADRDPVVSVIELTVDGRAFDIPPAQVEPRGTPIAIERATASNVFRGLARYGPEMAIDGDPETRWATDAGTRSAWLEVDLGRPASVGRVWVREAYPGRVREWEFRYLEGDTWRTLRRGTELGESADLETPPVTARRFRLEIHRATEGPTLAELRLFPPDRP